jgi:hypothetical protein
MRKTVLMISVLLFSSLAAAQTAATAPQSARQALIEMFFGTAPNHLERHLPDVTRKSFMRMSSSESQTLLAELSSLSSQVKASGAKLEMFDTGPMILTVQDKGPGNQASRLDVSVERDDLIGDEDEIELALHLPQELREQALPLTPHLTFALKTEADVWRLTDITITVKFPLADPDFLKSIEDSQRKKSEQMTVWSMRTIGAAEEGYHSGHGTYACSLTALADASKPGPGGGVYFDPELASGKKGAYVLAISGCDAAHYKAVAEPAMADSGQRAFCTDERGSIRASADGKATTCLSSGEEIDQKIYPPVGTAIVE